MYTQVPGFPLYLVNDTGTVVSMQYGKWRHMKGTDSKGYRHVNLTRDGKMHTLKVHRVVAEAFLGKSDLQINHRNGNKSDNRLENLEYCTASENVQHAHNTGLAKSLVGEYCGRSKLSDIQAADLLALKGKMTQQAAGKLFGVSRSCVWHIWSGSSRKHLRAV